MIVLKTQLELTNYIHSVSPKSLGLKGNDKHVLATLSFYMTDKEVKGLFTCFPSHKELADKTGFGVSTVRKCLSNLEKLGYISSRIQYDNSKIYTWLGFDSKRSDEVVEFLEKENKRLAKKKELDKIRGSNLGRNRAKIQTYEQILSHNPECTNAKLILEQIKLALKLNILYKDFQGYKDIISSGNSSPKVDSLPPYEEQTSIKIDEEPPHFEQVPLECYEFVDFEEIDKDFNYEH